MNQEKNAVVGGASVLLCSVGTSPLVVAEAFLTRPQAYGVVRCLTSANEQIDARLLESFFAGYPAVDFHLERIAGFVDLRDQEEHDLFEEALFRWYVREGLELSSTGTVKRLPEVCLAGGFKSMVAALQKAAQWFGAERVFHVLCEAQFPAREAAKGFEKRPPRTLAELEEAMRQGALRAIELGSEPGWPVLQNLKPPDEGAGTLRELIREHLEGVKRRAQAWEHLKDLPFPSLAVLPPAALDELEQPLDAVRDAGWVAALPKVELHCHLGGFATLGESLEKVRAAARDPQKLPDLKEFPEPAGWPKPEKPIALDDYMRLGDNTGSVLLKDPGCLQAQIDAVYAYLLGERVVYAEIRCSPNNYVKPEGGHASAWAVLEAIREGFQQNMDRARQSAALVGASTPLPCHVNLIVIATRRDDSARGSISRHLALAITAAQHHESLPSDACRVVGVDLAGFENRETRPAIYAADFEPVHRCGLAVTVHAGENDDAESIWQAVFRLNARRIGHALRLGESPDLLRSVADRGIGLEMCPYANYQIHGFHPMRDQKRPLYPLRRYLQAGGQVSVNTDNPGISGAGLSANILLLAELCPEITRMDVLRLLRNAAVTAFLPADQRRDLLTDIDRFLPV